MDRPDSDRIRVLVVDDDAAVAELTATYLQRHGFETEVAIGSEAGLRRLEGDEPETSEASHSSDRGGWSESNSDDDGSESNSENGKSDPVSESTTERVGSPDDQNGEIDCVVSDHDMPKLTGIDLLEAVREVEPDLPFVLFTGKGSEEIASEAISAGVSEYLQKGRGTDRYAVLANRIRTVVEKHRNERNFHEERAFAASVLDATPMSVYAFDVEGRILRWNDRFGAVTGYDDEEIAEMDPLDFVPSEEHGRIAARIEQVLAGDIVTVESSFETNDGTVIPQEFRAARVTDGEGNVSGLVGTGRDVTDRREYERMLERQNDRLEEFASVLSHDLRNPLGVATGYLELAKETGDEADFERVERAHERIERLIERILVEARYGRTVTDVAPVDLAAAGKTAFETVEVGSATLRVEDRLRLVADEERLCQLLENLFRNAIEQGSPEAEIEVGALSHRAGFYLADNGPGIPADERERVFENGYSTASEGTGFGLAIVARLAEAHGWEVCVTESESGGARFEISGVEVA